MTTLLPATERLSRTKRNLPKLPKGLSIASSSPPTLPLVYPCSQTGTEDAAIAAAAPKHWSDTCEVVERLEVRKSKDKGRWLILTMGSKNPA